MTLIDEIINEHIDLLIEASRDRGRRYPVRSGNLGKTVNKMQFDKNKGEIGNKGRGKNRGKSEPYQSTKSKRSGARNNDEKPSKTTPANNSQTTNDDSRTATQSPTSTATATSSPTPTTSAATTPSVTTAPMEKPKPPEGGATCDSNDYVGKFINKIKDKIAELYVGWPKSLFSMNEDDESRTFKNGDTLIYSHNRIKDIVKSFNRISKESSSEWTIRKMFDKLFELWNLTNTDSAEDCDEKCSAVKKNLKNYRKIFTTYRSKFTNAFKTLDINKSQLQREYKIMRTDIEYWEERMSNYSPKIQKILREHIAMLEDNKSTYKSRMFWYFKAPKFMRRKTKSAKKASNDKWGKRRAAYKRFRQKGRQAIKNYFNRGPKAGSSPSGEKK